MTIEEFASVIDHPIEILMRPGFPRDMLWYAHFQDGEIKRGNFLEGTSGNGRTPQEALDVYAREISGRVLVFDVMSETKRREYNVPAVW